MSDRSYVLRRKRGLAELSPKETEEVVDCYGRYADCPRDAFLGTLGLASDIYLVRDGDGRLRGFAALRQLELERPARAWIDYFLYADIDPPFRSRNVVQRIFLSRRLTQLLHHPIRPSFVVYSASTWLSYLWMCRNLAEYWPRRSGDTPAAIGRLADSVVRRLGIEDWDRDGGLLRRHGRLRYREGVVSETERRSKDPDLRFYAERNPRQREGDSLVCVFPLHLRNMIRMVTRMIARLLAQHRSRPR